jgi:hypothetical protein
VLQLQTVFRAVARHPKHSDTQSNSDSGHQHLPEFLNRVVAMLLKSASADADTLQIKEQYMTMLLRAIASDVTSIF